MEILIIFFLILLNGFFSMAEIALVSARKSRLETAAKKGNKNAKVALALANNPNKFLSTVQIGITLIGLLTGIYSGENITNDVVAIITRMGAPVDYAHGMAVAIVLVIITFFSLVFGELLPKRIGLANPEAIAKLAATPMRITSIITAPFVWLLTKTTDLLLKILNIKPSIDSKVTEEEIKAIVQEGTEFGEVEEIEQHIVGRVFSLGDRKVSSLMTHRKDIVFLNVNDSKEEVLATVDEELHSIYPVFENDRDKVLGIVTLKDLFALTTRPGFALKQCIVEPRYLLENTLAYDALEVFIDSKVHYGIVTDEFGLLQGILTINDILEALVGDVSDFHTEDYTIVNREDGSWLIDGNYPFYDFLSFLELTEIAPEYDINTVAGLVLHHLNNIPTVGEKITWLNYEIEVIDMDGARIDKILLKKQKE